MKALPDQPIMASTRQSIQTTGEENLLGMAGMVIQRMDAHPSNAEYAEEGCKKLAALTADGAPAAFCRTICAGFFTLYFAGRLEPVVEAGGVRVLLAALQRHLLKSSPTLILYYLSSFCLSFIPGTATF